MYFENKNNEYEPFFLTESSSKNVYMLFYKKNFIRTLGDLRENNGYLRTISGSG